MTDLDPMQRLTEDQAIAWLGDRGVRISIRTLREMRARREIGFFELPRGRQKIRFSPQQLAEAFFGREIVAVSGERPRPSRHGSQRALDRRLRDAQPRR